MVKILKGANWKENNFRVRYTKIASERLVRVIPAKKKHNACYGNNKATDPLVFKECFVRDIIRTLPICQVSIDDTMITVHEGHTSTEVQMDVID